MVRFHPRTSFLLRIEGAMLTSVAIHRSLATREGIRQIVETFREHLSSAFKFPPHVVKALEQFVD